MVNKASMKLNRVQNKYRMDENGSKTCVFFIRLQEVDRLTFSKQTEMVIVCHLEEQKCFHVLRINIRNSHT